MTLGGQALADNFVERDEHTRKLGAQLLLSEVLEYCVHGLGVTPEFNGVAISEPNQLSYTITNAPSRIDMLDGLADVAYTMYWNSEAFGAPLEEAFELVCDNNLEKFVRIEKEELKQTGVLPNDKWDCALSVTWPSEVDSVQVVKVGDEFYAVGKDASGKVRKPSTYKSVNLEGLL